MMFCEKCGSENPDSSRFCERCGVPLQTPKSYDHRISTRRGIKIPVRKGKPSKWSVAVALEIIVLAALAFGMKWIGSMYYSPAYVAEKYFELVMEGDLKKAYEYLDIEESVFLSAEQFEKVFDGSGRGRLIDFSVRETAQGHNSATVAITYRLAHDQTEQIMELFLQKSLKRKYFMFHDWKINSSGIVEYSVPIAVPVDAAVCLDGITLGERYQTKSSNGRDFYKIPALFCGNHVLEAVREGAQEIVQNRTLTAGMFDQEEGGYLFFVNQMYLKEKNLRRLCENAQSVFKSIMDAKVKGADEKFIDKLVQDSTGAAYTKRYYRDLYVSDSRYIKVKDIQITSRNLDASWDGGEEILSQFPLASAVVEVTSSCTYGDSYEYEMECSVTGLFFYGYVDGKYSLLAIKMTH